MTRALVAVAAVAALFVVAWNARPRAVEFECDLASALTRANSSPSSSSSSDWIVAHVRRADRPLGAVMDRETLTSRDVRAAAHAGFVHVRVDADREPELAERIAGPGAALATVVLDERGEVVAELPGFADAARFVEFLDAVRAKRPAIEAARGGVDLAQPLFELGAARRAESEVDRVMRELGDELDRRTPLAVRAVTMKARLLAARGQAAAAEEMLRRVDGSYPARPSASDAEPSKPVGTGEGRKP
jgi:hypothetical protein